MDLQDFKDKLTQTAINHFHVLPQNIQFVGPHNDWLALYLNKIPVFFGGISCISGWVAATTDELIEHIQAWQNNYDGGFMVHRNKHPELALPAQSTQTIKPQPSTHLCHCSIQTIMSTGCKCKGK